ncbi:MAG: hypothetical protein FWC89_04700 [Defluviitaleaceae bacterium]|nr:hypothetical protein [Defluviitaleaceae bacterium]
MPEFYGFKTGKVKELINPELPDIKVKGGGTDVVFLMEDNTYLHLGFETRKDMDDVSGNIVRAHLCTIASHGTCVY